ncbi:MAG TPA: exonuclease domain-containing protein [Candidatus Hydrogenedentes bacterium]|nr:exonuclease domain-containing protein [Candidatus Hydrogenedentota bacterium]
MKTTFIAFDFETTGLHPMAAEIIEIGAVKFDVKGKVLGTFEQLIKPAGGIQPEAEAVNGISAAMVANCPSLDEVLPRFIRFIGSPQQNVLIAHNAAKFDIGFLAVACARRGLPLPEHRIVDSIDLCQACMPPPYNLASVCRRLGIAMGAHRALSDAVAVMRLTLRLGSKYPRAWENLPTHYAEEFGIAAIEPPPGFVEWEALGDPNQEVEIVYAGGSRPGQKRRVIPKSFFEYKGREYMTAFCLQDGRTKTFAVDDIVSAEMVEDEEEDSEDFVEVSGFAQDMYSRQPEDVSESLQAPTKKRTSLADIFLVIIGVCFAGVIIVVLLMAFGFLMEVQEVSGDLGVFLVIGIFLAALVLGNAAYHLINAVIEDIFG